MSINEIFDACKTDLDLHNELRTQLICNFLHEEKCKDAFLLFKSRCRKYLTTPVEEAASNAEEILDLLSRKGKFNTGKYEEMKELVDLRSGELLEEAETRINAIKGKALPMRTSVTAVQPDTLLAQTKKKVDLIQLSTMECLMCRLNQGENVISLIQKFPDLDEISSDFIKLWHGNYCRCRRELGQELVLKFITSGAEHLQKGEKKFEHFKTVIVPTLKEVLMRYSATVVHTFLGCGKPVSVAESSVLSYWTFHTSQGLNMFWSMYTDGSIEKAISECFSSAKALQLLGVEKISLRTIITEEDFHRYKATFGFAKNMAGVEEEEELAQWMPICDECDSVAEYYCTTCWGTLCTGCKGHHLSRWKNRRHHVVPYSAGMMAAKKSKSVCSTHPGQRYTFFCETCQTPLCIPCLRQSHANHDVMNIETAFSAARKEATLALEKMMKTISSTMKDYSENVQKMATESLESIERSEQEMRSTAQRLHEYVDLTLAKSLKQLFEMKENRIQPVIQSQERRRDEMNRKLGKTIKEYEDKLRSKDPIGLLDFMKGKYSQDLESEFPVPDIEAVPLISFNPSSPSQEAMQTHLGSLTLSEIKVDDTAGADWNTSVVTETVMKEKDAEKDKNKVVSGWSVWRTREC